MTFKNENSAKSDYGVSDGFYSLRESELALGETDRKKRLRLLLRIFGLCFALVSFTSMAYLVLKPEEVNALLFTNQDILFRILILSLSFVAGVSVIVNPDSLASAFRSLRSLRSEKSEYSTTSESGNDAMHILSYVDRRFEDLDVAIKLLQGSEIPAEGRTLPLLNKKERDELAKRIEVQMIDKLSAESLRAIALDRASEEARDFRLNALRRLGGQVEVLGSRANSNLTWGISFSTFGIVILFFVFFYSGPSESVQSSGAASIVDQATWLHFLESYLPRFSLVILIEIVAFFFLRLYSRTLSEIRYFQNETTNIEMQLVALLSAVSLQNADATGSAIAKLASTERNSTIEKTQTTAEIEMHRADAEASESYINAVTNLVHGTEKASFWRRKE